MEGKITYRFSGKLWKSAGAGGWYFVSVPPEISKEIRQNLKWQEEGWGRMKVVAKTENVKWDTAIWFDKKKKTYLLPIKAQIRNELKCTINQVLDLYIWV